MRIVNVCLSLLISLLLALLVFEGGLRLMGKGPVDSGMDPHPRLGWSLRENYVLQRDDPVANEYDITIRTNEWRMRGESMPDRAKPAGVFRVAALGDSFTLGFTVSEDDLFVEQLERWWRKENRRVDVVNAGTQAYSTDQAVAWFELNGKEFAPDLVMLFPYENDIYWNGQTHYQTSPKPLYSPEGQLETGELEAPPAKSWWLKTAIGYTYFKPTPKSATFVPEGASKPIRRENAPLLLESPEFLADAQSRTRGALIALQRQCDELGARLIVAPIPSRSAVDPQHAAKRFGPSEMGGLTVADWNANLPVDFFLGLCGELGIEALDVRPVLEERIAAGEQVYFKSDWHLNPDGNKAFSGFLHGGLEGLGVFPAENSATRVATLPEPVPQPRGFPRWLMLYLSLWVVLGTIFIKSYPDEPMLKSVVGVGLLLGCVFAIWMGLIALLGVLPPRAKTAVGLLFVFSVLGFVAYKLGRRMGTIAELLKAFTLRGHWYLMPLVVVLLTIGSLLVVAASSPLIAPFIYTLF